MDYGDVKGAIPRYWTITASSDPRFLDLEVGDLLVFDETGPGGIARIRPTNSLPLDRVLDWGSNCKLAVVSGFDFALNGTHKNSAKDLTIKFTAASGTNRAQLEGEIPFPAGATWMADEGP